MWGIVEVTGHIRHAGRIRVEERFGTKLMHVEVPAEGDPAANGWISHFYGPNSIYSYQPSDEPTVLRVNRPVAREGRP